MDLNIVLSALALLTTTISLVVSLRKVLIKRKAEEKFIQIIKGYLKRKDTPNDIIELIIKFDQHLKISIGSNKAISRATENSLKKRLKIDNVQKDFISLAENLDEKDKNLINEGLTQPSTIGRLRYIAKLLEKAK